MCNTTTYQFVSGFLVGVVLCLWFLSHVQYYQMTRYVPSSNERIGQSVDFKNLASWLRRWISPNQGSNNNTVKTSDSDLKYTETSIHFKNRITITCIVPLLGNHTTLDQSDAIIIIKWVRTCDHVIFVRNGRRLKHGGHPRKIIKEFMIKGKEKTENLIRYYHILGKFSRFGGHAELRYQYKAMEYAYRKFPNTSLFVLTPSATDVAKDSIERFLNNSETIYDIKGLQKHFSNHTLSDSVLSMDKFFLMTKNAVEHFVRMEIFGKCTMENFGSFQEWASNCTEYGISML